MNYITIKDPRTGIVQTLKEAIEQEIALTTEEKRDIDALSPDAQYSIFMSTYKDTPMTLKKTLWEKYQEYARTKGKQIETREQFEQSLIDRTPGLLEVSIGNKEYWLGIGIR